LFVVDSNQNRLLAFAGFSTLGANAIALEANGSFMGPSASLGRVIYEGPPLNAPLSTAELYNGDLLVANTGDNNLIEISQAGQINGVQNLDTGAAGALFGLAASGGDAGTTKIYFNDDNDNTVKLLAIP
jgi:hypothetical protein